MCRADFNKLIGEDFPEKVPLKLRTDWKLAMQTVGGGAFHREKPTCRRKSLREGVETVHTTAVWWPEMNCGGRLGVVKDKR